MDKLDMESILRFLTICTHRCKFLKIPLQVIMAGLRGPFITLRGSVDTKILFKIGPLARKMNIYYMK